MNIASLAKKYDHVSPLTMVKPKVIIFSCNGGGGHISASRALQETLGTEYDTMVFDVFAEVFDPLSILTAGKLSAANFYNWSLQKGHITLVNVLNRLSVNIFRLNRNGMKNRFIELLEQERPALVISVVPFVNGALAEAAKEYDVPFVVVPTDLDSKTFITSLNAEDNDNLYYTVPFNAPEILNTLAPTGVNPSQVVVTGFPLRTAFFESKDVAAIKNEFNVPQNKFTILIMMGACGSLASYRYAAALAKTDLPIHVIVCLGKNEPLRSALQAIELPATMTMTIIGFTDRIADLMAVADLCITKSGTVSVCETLYMELPVILDATATVLTWEYFNHPFIANHKFGVSLKNIADLESVVRRFIQDPSYYKRIKQNLTMFEKRKFAVTIKGLVDHIILGKPFAKE